MTKFARRLLVVFFVPLWFDLSHALQDEGLIQRNTAHLSWYPEDGDIQKKASALAESGRYVEALAIYDEALERRPNTVIPMDVDKTFNLGLREYVLRQIASWPEEGKAAYRRRADPLAEHLFQGAKRTRDVEALERVVDQYPLSTVVDDALILIANIRLDAGDHVGAADALSRLLDRDGGTDRSVVIARLGLAWARAGRKAAILELIRRVDRDVPGAKVRVGGNEIALAEHLKSLADGVFERPADAAPLALPAWEMIGGGPAGSRLAEPGVELSKSAWVDVIGLPRLDGEDEFVVRRSMTLVPTAEYRPLYPAVSDGILYVHNGLALTAYNFFARQPERLWQFRVPTPSGEVMFDNRVIFAPMVHDGRVYANLISSVGGEENQLGYVRVKFPFPRRALYALDAYTGKLLWKLGGKLNTDSLEENATFATAPTADGGRLYVGAVKQKLSTDPFQHYVLCLDPATGKILWSTYVASGGTEINLFGNSTRESLGSPVAVTEDSVYYCTNHGAITALDKKSGRIRWTYRYRQLPVMPTRSVYVQKNRLEWVNSPPVVSRGIAVVTPTDSHSLYALDTQTGRLRWDRPRGQDVRVVYGVMESTLVLGGERLELCDLQSGKQLSPPMTDELRGSGRGVIAADGIYVPCQDKLRKVSWEGTWDEASARRWPAGLGDGGNLFIVDGAVVLASQDSIQVFFDRRDQERSIQEALAKNPDDPSVLYRGALRYLQSGDASRAAELLTKTVEKTANSPRPEDERLQRAARKRLFAVAMEAGRSELELGRPAQAAEHFAAARAHAADLPAIVEASIQLARVRLIRKQDAEAVSEYQRLLLEHGEETVEGARVFDLARNAIQATLAVVGREPYAAHEASAKEMLEEARRASTADALQRVFRLYPNSLAAEEALFEAAGIHVKNGRPEEEISALRQFLRECSDSGHVPEATARLVRALEKKGHTASAGALLRRMIRQFPDAPIKEGDGRIPAKEFAEKRLKSDAYARAPGGTTGSTLQPELKLRFVAVDKEFPEGALPLRTVGTPPAGVEDLVFLHYVAPNAVAVKALDGASGAEVWRFSKLKSQVRFAGFLEEALILADDETVVRLDPRTGRVIWAYDSKARMWGFALSGPLLLFLVQEPEAGIVALEAVRGAIAWHQPFEGIACSRIHPAGEAVAFLTLKPNRIQLFEVETGKRLLSTGAFPEGGTAPQVIHAGDDVLVLHFANRSVEAYDLPSGKLRWRQLRTRLDINSMEMSADGLVTLGTQRLAPSIDPKLFLETISLRTGKIVLQKEPKELGTALFMKVDGDQAIVVSREPDKAITVRGVALSDFSVRWTTPLGGNEATLLPPEMTRDHFILGAFLEDPKLVRYSYRAWLLDKQGRVVQNIPRRPEEAATFERPPAYLGAAHDRLIICVENKVEVHK
jgi:outer membrane protein assembly factor BamB/TolA-binding protein